MRHVLIATKKRRIYGSGPIATAPAPSQGKLWVDGAMIYEGRWIGNVTGNDRINWGVPASADGINSNCEVSFGFRTDGLPTSTVVLFSNYAATNSRNIQIALLNNGKLELRTRDSVGSIIANIPSLGIVTNGSWYSISYKIESKVASLWVNGVFQGSGATSDTPEIATNMRLNYSNPTGTQTFMQYKDFSVLRSGNIFLSAKVDEGVGLIAYDNINGNNGVIADDTPFAFWQLAWVTLLNDSIVGYGPLSSAPAPTEALRNKIFVETGDPLYPNGRVHQYKYVYTDLGNDRIECGTPTWLTTKTRPAIDSFTVDVYANVGNAGGNYCPLIECSNSQAETVFQIAHQDTTNTVQMNVGGTRFNSSAQSKGTWRKYSLVANVGANNAQNTLDSMVLGSFTAGSFAGVYPLYIAGTGLGTYAFAGKIARVDIKNNVTGEMIDQYDFNNTTQWNGTLSGTSLNGFPFTITDGAPSGIRVVDLVPNDFPNDLVGVGTLASAPAPSVALLGKKYEQTDDVNYPLGRIWKYRYSAFMDVTSSDVMRSGDISTGIYKNDINIKFKMKVSDAAGIAYGIILNGASNINKGLRLDYQAGVFSFQLKNAVDSVYKSANYTIPNPTGWLNVEIDIIRDISATLYVNGIKAIEHINNSGWEPVNNDGRITIANRLAGSGITVIYYDLVITHDGKVVTYKMDEASGNTCIDSTRGIDGVYTDSAPATIHSIFLVPDQW